MDECARSGRWKSEYMQISNLTVTVLPVQYMLCHDVLNSLLNWDWTEGVRGMFYSKGSSVSWMER